jgi:hypothetical protein
MKKEVFLVIILMVSFSYVFAQNENNENVPTVKSEKFSTGMDVFTDIWMNVPDNITAKTINIGTNYYFTYNSPIGKSGKTPFSFAIGIGLGTHNFHSNALPKVDTNNISYFDKIPDSVTINGDIHKVNYKKNKISIAYFDIPMEFRYKSKSEFRAALGFKIGFLLSSHTKYKGDEYMDFNNDNQFDSYSVKMNKIPNIESMRYGIKAEVGYKWINVMGYYSLSSLFKDGKGPDTYPISVGLALRPF